MRVAFIVVLVWLIVSHAILATVTANSTAAADNDAASPIEHVVVLMMENRSFDHILGWLQESHPTIDGLNGTECNHRNAQDPKSPKTCVNKYGYDEGPDDPRHSFAPTTTQIFGYHKPAKETAIPRMSGFVQDAFEAKHNETNPMAMFTPTNAPVLNGLATNFAVFDRWFCSIPGPTDPNREYLMSGTSQGRTTNFDGNLLKQQSYFDWLGKRNVSWAAYYQDDPWAIMYFEDVHHPENSKNVGHLDKFFSELTAGRLPKFVFLQPRMTAAKGPPTWQHPDASVKEGEKLIQSIYSALRSSPFWNKLAFMVTYDEHGGFYDHVAPPQKNIPSPDGHISPEGFAFDRLGIRIPTIVASPWVNAGTVIHEPSGPTPTSQYEHTSVMSTVNKLFNIPGHMSDRAAWSGTFESIFRQRTTPRDDCPLTFTSFAPHTQMDMARQRRRVLNDHMEIQVEFFCKQNGHSMDTCNKNTFNNQGDASDFIEAEAEIFMARLRAKEAVYEANRATMTQ